MATKKSTSKTKTTTNKKTTGKPRGRKPKSTNNTTASNKKVVDDVKNKEMDKDKINEKVELLTSDFEDIYPLKGDEDKKSTEDSKPTPQVKKNDGNAIEWLESQVESLTNLNKKYEDEIIEHKKEIDRLKLSKSNSIQTNPNNRSKPDSIEIKRGVIDIYRELNNNYTGNNSTRKKWSRVKIDYLLDRFRKTFDFI